eukprot:5959058-Amphidinium_carterae.1
MFGASTSSNSLWPQSSQVPHHHRQHQRLDSKTARLSQRRWQCNKALLTALALHKPGADLHNHGIWSGTCTLCTHQWRLVNASKTCFLGLVFVALLALQQRAAKDDLQELQRAMLQQERLPNTLELLAMLRRASKTWGLTECSSGQRLELG